MHKKSVIAIMFLLGGLQGNAQTARDSVAQCIQKLFTAMKAQDTATLRQCFMPKAILQTVVMPPGRPGRVNTDSVQQFLNAVASAPKGSLDERISIGPIQTDGTMASAWIPYSFYFNNNFSHCGVNSFQLVNTGEGWKVQYLIDTRRKNGCESK